MADLQMAVFGVVVCFWRAPTHHSFKTARYRLNRNEILQRNTHFAAFSKSTKTTWLNFQKCCEILQKISATREKTKLLFVCKNQEIFLICKILQNNIFRSPADMP